LDSEQKYFGSTEGRFKTREEMVFKNFGRTYDFGQLGPFQQELATCQLPTAQKQPGACTIKLFSAIIYGFS
jgi:hypothetical protein